MPHLSSTPGRKFSATMSNFGASRQNRSRPACALRLSVTPRLFRFTALNSPWVLSGCCVRRPSAIPSGTRGPTVRQISGRWSASICTTSAPSSASNWVASVPDQACVNASTRTPSSGPAGPARRGSAGGLLDSPRSSSSSSASCSPKRGAERRSDQIGGSIRPGPPGARALRVLGAVGPSSCVRTKNLRSRSCSFSTSSSIDCRQPEMQRNSASAWNSGQRSISGSSRIAPARTADMSRAYRPPCGIRSSRAP